VSQLKPNETVPKGVVFDQSPKADTKLAKGKDVLLSVSSGPSSVPIPTGLTGLSQDAATKILIDAGFTVNPVNKESDSVEAGRVVGTVPGAGVLTPTSTPVQLLVSTGKALTPIPDVAGRSQDQARKALQAAGFVVGDVKVQGSVDVDKGKVIGTDPTGSAPKGSTVDLIVSGGPAQVNVPTVLGQSEADATNAIKARGLDVAVKPKTVPSGDSSVGRVIDQSPAGGTPVDPGTAVTIVVGVGGASPPTTLTLSPTTTTGP